MQSYRFSYAHDTSEEFFDAAVGILILGRKLPKKNRLTSYRQMRKRSKYAWIFFAAAHVLLTVETAFMKSHNIAPTLQIVMTAGKVLTLVFFFVNLLTWFYCKKIFTQLSEASKTLDFKMGEFSFDESGICDSMDDKSVEKRPWSVYKDCVVTKRVTALRWKTDLISLFPTTEESTQCILNVLNERGLSDSMHICTME